MAVSSLVLGQDVCSILPSEAEKSACHLPHNFSPCLLGGLREAMRCALQDRSNQPDQADAQPAPILLNGQWSLTLCTARQRGRFLSWHGIGPCFPSGLLPAMPGFCSLRSQYPPKPSTSCRHWFAHGHFDMNLKPQTWVALQLSVPEDCPSMLHLLLGIVAAWIYLCFLPST